MGQKITARSDQSLPDIALQEAGTMEALFALAKQNGLSITEKLEPGMQLAVDDLPSDPGVLEYYKRYSISPATVNDKNLYQGVNYWQIDYDFIIQ